jgi:hypothetical protein
MENVNGLFRCYMTSGQSRTGAALHFNSLLPRLNLPFGPLPHMVIANLVMASPKSRDILARKAARANAGRMPTELSDSVEIFKSYLHELNAIDGLIGVCHPHGYVLEFDAGLLFDTAQIGRRIAQLVHVSFYPELEFSFEIDSAYRSGIAQQTREGSIATSSSDLLRDETPF